MRGGTGPWLRNYTRLTRILEPDDRWEQNPRTDLVVVDSKEELDFISRSYNKLLWLGATDEAGEGMWRWVDGTVLSLDDPSWSGGGPQGAQVQKAGITDSIQVSLT
ncbi:unnamed protein product [Gadus morhua 'NCC']